MNRIDGDVGEIQRFAVDTLLASVNGVIALAGALALMLSLSWQLTLLALVLLPAELFFLRTMRPRVEGMTRRVRERSGDLSSFFFDTLGAMKLVQASGAEQREAERLEGLSQSYLKDLLLLQMVNFATAAVPNLMTSVSTAAVFIAGGALMIRGDLTLGTLIAFSAYLARATGPVQTLLGLYVAALRARVSLDRVMEITREAPTVAEPVQPRSIPQDAKGELHLEAVSFRFGPEQPEVLENIDLHLPSGLKTGLVGMSGAGKTTLIDLLHRHYDPDQGRILLDGQDLRDLDLAELRRRVAVVAQDTMLITGSLADNIRYAAPSVDEEAWREAARQAQVEAFATELPQGYDTPVGARGTALSGGQRQRVAIARALLQDPLILVLDEATSAVDLETEARIVEAIDALFPGPDPSSHQPSDGNPSRRGPDLQARSRTPDSTHRHVGFVMTKPLLIGLLDSGVSPELAPSIVAAKRFALDNQGNLSVETAEYDRLGHGTALAQIILKSAPEARLLVAQVFLDSIATTPAAVAAGLDWLKESGVRLVNMSFGLRHDREILRLACTKAADAGILLLAAAPARGPMVYPAGYPEVIKISGDARCAPGEISTLGGQQADFGAHPRPLPGSVSSQVSGGASFAVAHLCGHLAAFLQSEPEADRSAALAHLTAVACYHGPERRGVTSV